MRHSTWPCAAWVALLSSGWAPDPRAGDLATAEIDSATPLALAPIGNRAFDFGPILAHGQFLRHDFTLANPSEKPLRLLKATCFTPCCSAVESLPASIPPHGEGKVRVVFKPGHQSGPRAIRFAIETDSNDRPTRMLSLRARLFSQWEMIRLGDPLGSAPIGKGGKEIWRVVSRRKGSDGLRLPESIETVEPLQARFTGPAEEQVQPDGLVEATRDVEITLTAGLKLGSQQAEMAFLWPDGHHESQVIRWEVTPLVHLSPPSIVIEPSGGTIERSITITSDDGPFRIAGAWGDLLSGSVEVPSIAERTHRLSLRLVPSHVVAGGVSTIAIVTDHPRQPELILRVLILPPRHGK